MITGDSLFTLLSGPMLIEPTWFNQFLNSIENHTFSADTVKLLASDFKENAPEEPKIENGVAILNLHEMIFPTPNLFTRCGMGVALSEFNEKLIALKNDKTISTIIIDTNSPGGRVEGVPETAQLVAKVAKSKNVISYTHYLNASAAYWITSGATELYANKMSFIGSIGVITEAPLKKSQYGVILSNSISPNKHPDPETEEGKKVIIDHLDDVADFFIKAVAFGRGVDVETVTNDFGKGGVLIAQKATSAGMIDGVMPFDKVIDKYSTNASNIKSQTNVGGSIMNLEELKAQHPDLVKQIQAEATASINSVNTDLKRALLDMNSKLEASTAAQKEVTDRLVALEKENLKNKLIAKTIQVENQTNALIAASLQKSNIPSSFHKKFESFIDNSDCLNDDMVLDTAKLKTKVDAEIKEFEALLKHSDAAVAGLTVEGDSDTTEVDATVEQLLSHLK